MLWLLMWTLYGLIVGLIAKALSKSLNIGGEDLMGFLPTLAVGIAGSYIGGFINFLIGKGNPFQPSGLIMGIIGGIVFCWIYHRFQLKQFMQMRNLREQLDLRKAIDD